MKNLFVLMVSFLILFFGFFIKFRQTKRIKSIEKCIILLENIATSIDFSLDDIDKIIQNSSKSLDLCFLDEFISLEKNKSIKERFSSAVEKTYFFDCLKQEEINILTSFSDILGTTSKEGQIKNCKLYEEMLKKTADKLKNQSIQKGNSTLVLSFLCALGVIIIFV